MNRKVSIAVVVTLLSALLLYLWRLTYDFSDWAAVWLLLLAAMIFRGNWSIVMDHWSAERGIVLRPESWISGWLTGRTWAFLSSMLLVLVVVPVLAWQALNMLALEVSVLLALAFSSAWLFLSMQSFLALHVRPPFDKIFATGPSTWLIGLPFSSILFLVTWYAPTVPGEVLAAPFSESVQSALSELPERRGWIAEILALGYAFEAAKLWLVVQAREYRLVTLLFNLDTALFGFFAARASVVVTHFVETHYGKGGE
ncbi:hypothetical protein [Sedimentimonas flavescens]|uniref:hypothetical protein n=1 Tax=Sedimentimonas flavescens TaxID=2851012 RepID=UPI001C49E925|nr:hypothetical protein [Sedimentimonas flavescens]MBW0157607.1 hypothetical protein [Sedimentimonas flavescens]